jgi:uncharacterized protein (TIGR02118 family)
MLKLAFCLRRLPRLSRQEFQTYWREQHGPLVARHAAALGIVRYVQLHTVEDPLNAAFQAGRGGPEPFDGIAEIWWRDREALVAAVATPAGQRAGEALLADERRFIDHARSPLFLAEEHGVIQNSG